MKYIKTLLALGMLAGASAAHSAVLNEIETNNTLGTAQNIDASFSLDASNDIGDASGNDISTIAPHVTILGQGDGSYDYFSFTVGPGVTTGYFDIDYATNDTEIALWDSASNMLGANDDSFLFEGAGGSSSGLDSFLEYTFNDPGTYYIGVAQWPSVPEGGGWSAGSAVVASGQSYQLQVVLDTTPVPVPAAAWLLGSGVLAFAGLRRRKQAVEVATA